MNRLSENKIKMILVGILLLICLLLIFALNKKNNDENSKNNKNQITFNKVNDYNTYFFVQKNINNFLDNLSNSSSIYVYNMLNTNFVKENSISLENSLYDKDLSNTNTTYNMRIEGLKTYQLNTNVVLYDLKGNIYDNGYDIYKNVGNRRFILLVDYNNKAISIYPVLKKISNKDIVSKLKDKNNIENNNYNNIVTVSTVTESMMCITYYYDLYNLMVNDQDKALSMIQNIESIEQMKKLIKDNNLFQNIKSCSSDGTIGKKVYYINDDAGNKYTFREQEIMNYTVSITK